jgi:hypothetical protein
MCGKYNEAIREQIIIIADAYIVKRNILRHKHMSIIVWLRILSQRIISFIIFQRSFFCFNEDPSLYFSEQISYTNIRSHNWCYCISPIHLIPIHTKYNALISIWILIYITNDTRKLMNMLKKEIKKSGTHIRFEFTTSR